MKTIYVMRHPEKDMKSSSDDFFVKLTQKGIEDAHTIARKLKEQGVQIDLIVSSPALRAETTSMIMAEDLEIKKNVLYNEVLYQGFLDELIEAIHFTFHTVNTILIVGHNPLLANLINHFTGLRERLDMGVVCKINFDTTNWIEVDSHNAHGVEIIRP